MNIANIQLRKPSLEKVRNIFGKLQNFDILVNWIPSKASGICPSSIAKYFSLCECDVKTCKPELNTRIRYNVKIPDLKVTDLDSAALLAEWIGMYSLDVDIVEDSENFISSYKIDEPYSLVKKLHHIRWKGFFTSEKVQDVLNACR